MKAPRKLTPPEIMALRFLSRVDYATVAQIGQKIRLDTTVPMSPKALQRSGRKVAKKLERGGMVEPAYRRNDAYRILPRGSQALRAPCVNPDPQP